MENKTAISYEIDLDDVKAYLVHNFDNNPKVIRSNKQMHRFVLPLGILILVLAVINYILDKQNLSFPIILVAVGITSILISLFFSRFIRSTLLTSTLKTLNQKPNKLVGKHQMSITADAITDISEIGESTTNWKGISNFVSNDKYLFLLVRGADVYIVPKRAFPDVASFTQLVDTAKGYYQAAAAK
jgi:hypothetical protein